MLVAAHSGPQDVADKMIRLLLSAGADLTIVDNVGNNACDHAARAQNWQLFNLLARNGCAISPSSAQLMLLRAIRFGKISLAEKALALGAKANDKLFVDIKGSCRQWPALFVATAWCRADIMQLLITRGANIFDDEWRTPWDYYSTKPVYSEIENILLRAMSR